ncbi:MAG TPA: DUF4136 domain-containing protein [Rhodothermia bacterium]
MTAFNARSTVPVAALLVPILLASCSSVSVTTDFAEDADFAQYRTFEWMPVPEGLYAGMRLGPTMDNRIRRAIESELVLKGLQRATEGAEPDLFVVYHAAVREDAERAYYDSWGYGRMGRWRSGTVVVEPLTRGTLIVDLVDADQNSLVWRGKASGVVSSPTEAGKRVFEAIQRILEGYPPS